jgi:hypothetical protein
MWIIQPIKGLHKTIANLPKINMLYCRLQEGFIWKIVNGGKRVWFIKFIREASMIPIRMGLVIFRELLKNWII